MTRSNQHKNRNGRTPRGQGRVSQNQLLIFDKADRYKSRLESANGHRPTVLAELRAMDENTRGFIVSTIADDLKEYLELENEIDACTGSR